MPFGNIGAGPSAFRSPKCEFWGLTMEGLL